MDSGGSTDSYILQSTIDPRLHMGVRHEEFFQFLLDSQLVSWHQAQGRLRQDLDRRQYSLRRGGVKGLAISNEPSKQQKNFKETMSREDEQEWAEVSQYEKRKSDYV